MLASLSSNAIQLAIIFSIIYFTFRFTSKGVSGLTGSGYRSYRQLAKRFQGRYESRGLADPPTVSFNYRDSLVRVGLAPVIAGQPKSPKTRVVTRFPAGIPLRLELIPTARPAPHQLPKGTRRVATDDPAFDAAFTIFSNDPDMACEFVKPMPVRQTLVALLRLAPPSGMLISINPERLLVQVDRNLGASVAQLDLAVRSALLLHDALHAAVETRVADGIEIVTAEMTDPAEGPPECKVCGEPIEGKHVRCAVCQTPFHHDCWSYIGACATFGCTSRKFTAGSR
jgi:hypothetical protein